MYVVALKELMSQATPGKPPRQAPRFPTILLAAFEDMVLAIDRTGVYPSSVVVGGTLRFDGSSWALASRVCRDFYGPASQAHQV